MIDQRMTSERAVAKTSFREVNEFIQSFHNEFKDFATTQQRDKFEMVRCECHL